MPFRRSFWTLSYVFLRPCWCDGNRAAFIATWIGRLPEVPGLVTLKFFPNTAGLSKRWTDPRRARGGSQTHFSECKTVCHQSGDNHGDLVYHFSDVQVGSTSAARNIRLETWAIMDTGHVSDTRDYETKHAAQAALYTTLTQFLGDR